MLRGVIKLKSEEIKEALIALPESEHTRPIFYKLNAAIKANHGELELQVSEDELEMMIDNMGLPSNEDTAAKKSLRNKLQKFLIALKV